MAKYKPYQPFIPQKEKTFKHKVFSLKFLKPQLDINLNVSWLSLLHQFSNLKSYLAVSPHYNILEAPILDRTHFHNTEARFLSPL